MVFIVSCTLQESQRTRLTLTKDAANIGVEKNEYTIVCIRFR